ncbi:hypothetical protein [Akkermansia glycaniphila]|uniref:Uncharacterized protein n=1 Tax=Akkermansia glycaniphila TaxID=1679444 RepID=A0A1H6LB36_9BACT|nr:hypothetical protein [Akkermansia glycaniphila]MBT9450875.1 hypothetical protein [Akkermansia glycaniphila]SEH85754.1 Hypothetical protein PYTT_1250 [Akkermansia glycaniphila]
MAFFYPVIIRLPALAAIQAILPCCDHAALTASMRCLGKVYFVANTP